MIIHTALADTPFARSRRLKLMIDTRQITLAGNVRLKIYGTLQCRAGKRMKMTNRVFFATADEAVSLGYHPCGNCMRAEYRQWKISSKTPAV